LKFIRKIFPEERHFYEIIPQGKSLKKFKFNLPKKKNSNLIIDTPCRLYFDLEFQKAINKNSNGEEMIQFFKKVFFYSFFIFYSYSKNHSNSFFS